MKNIIEEYRAIAEPVVKHYHNDINIDCEILEKGNPSLFFIYDCGSHSITLTPLDKLPAKGETVKYLFGYADRDFIVRETGATLECESLINAPVVVYFNNGKLKKISHEKAGEIVADYKKRLFREMAA